MPYRKTLSLQLHTHIKGIIREQKQSQRWISQNLATENGQIEVEISERNKKEHKKTTMTKDTMESAHAHK